MNDREFLEMAAKAAGYEVRWHDAWECFVHIGIHHITSPATMAAQRPIWTPLSDYGDALRLAVRLKLNIEPSISRDGVYVGPHGTAPWAEDAHESQDIFGATRRAIVRAAAEIGKSTP